MKKLRKIYQGLSLREHLIGSLLLAVVLTTLLVSIGTNAFVSMMVSGGLCVGFHIILLYPTQLANALVVLFHTGLLAISFTAYGAILTESMGATGYLFSVIVLSITSILIGVVAYKTAVGRLWITLLLAFLSIDIGGLLLIIITKSPNIFLGIYLAAVILVIRSVRWRGLINRSHGLPLYLQKDEATGAIKSLLESKNGIYADDNLVKCSPINAVYKQGNTTFLMNIIAPAQDIVIGKKITTEQTVLDDLFFETTSAANFYIKKNKIQGEIITCVVNAADPKKTILHLNMNPKGNKRGKDRTVFLFSPSGLISQINKLEKEDSSLQSQQS
jgi:hypothetical protein